MSGEAAAAPPSWNPPLKIEDLYAQTAGNQFAAINAPTSGARDDKEVPRGPASFQLYSLATPNGVFHFRPLHIAYGTRQLAIHFVFRAQSICHVRRIGH